MMQGFRARPQVPAKQAKGRTHIKCEQSLSFPKSLLVFSPYLHNCNTIACANDLAPAV